MEQPHGRDFNGVTLAILFNGKLAVRCMERSAPGPRWSLPQSDRQADESPADCALHLLSRTLGLELPVTRLNWPIIGSTQDPSRWFFAAWITPAEWQVVNRSGGPRDTVMLGIPAFLAATSVPAAQKDALRNYLEQPRPHLGQA